MQRYVETTTYLQVEKHSRHWLRGVVRRATSKRPTEPLGNAVVVKLVIKIPEEAFEPLKPEATVVVPVDLVQKPVVVEAEETDGF